MRGPPFSSYFRALRALPSRLVLLGFPTLFRAPRRLVSLSVRRPLASLGIGKSDALHFHPVKLVPVLAGLVSRLRRVPFGSG